MKQLDRGSQHNDFKKMTEAMSGLVNLTCNNKNVEDFPFKPLYLENVHVMTVTALSIGIKENKETLIQKCLMMISNLTLATDAYLSELFKLDFLVYFGRLLKPGYPTYLKPIFWSLSNLLVAVPKIKLKLCQFGFIDFLIDNATQIKKKSNLHSTIIWFLSNFFNVDPILNQEIRKLLIEKYYDSIFSKKDSELVIESLNMLLFYIKKEKKKFINENIKVVSELIIYEELLDHVCSSDIEISKRAVELFAFLTSLDEIEYVSEISFDFKEGVLNVIEKGNDQTKRNAFWLMSNLVFESYRNMKSWYGKHVMQICFQFLNSEESSQELIYEIFYFLKTVYDKMGTVMQKEIFLLNYFVLEGLLFHLKEGEEKLLHHILDFIKKIIDVSKDDYIER